MHSSGKYRVSPFAFIGVGCSINQFKSSFTELTFIATPLRAATHLVQATFFRRKLSLSPVSSRRQPSLIAPVRVSVPRSAKTAREGFLDPRRVPARRGATRRDAAWRGAERCVGRDRDAREGRFPALRSQPLDGITMETDVPIPLFPEIFPREAPGAPCFLPPLLPRAIRTRPARLAFAFVLPQVEPSEGRRIELGRICEGEFHPSRPWIFL